MNVPEAAHAPAASQTLRELVGQIIQAAEQPLGIADVKSELKARSVPVGGKKGYRDADIDADLNAEVVAGTAHLHPATTATGKPKFWHKPPKTAAEQIADRVRQKVADLGEHVLATESQLGKPTPSKATPDTAKAFTDTLNELLHQGKLHRRGTKFGKVPPPPEPTPAEKLAHAVRENAARLRDDELVTEAKLGKPSGKKATPETRQAFSDTLQELLHQKRLFRHGTNLGRRPPKWYESEPAKKPFGTLVKAVKQLLDLNVAPAEEMFALLRQQLGLAPLTTETPQSNAVQPPAADFATSFDVAFDRLDRLHGSNNFVSLVDLRAEFPHLPREEFDAAVNGLRRVRRYTLKSAERVQGFTPEEQDASIKEEGEYLLYVSRVRS